MMAFKKINNLIKTTTLRDKKVTFSVSGWCFSLLYYIAVEETFYLSLTL